MEKKTLDKYIDLVSVTCYVLVAILLGLVSCYMFAQLVMLIAYGV